MAQTTRDMDLVQKAKEIVDAGKQVGVPIRILGAIATRLHCSVDSTSGLKRELSDIDLMAYGRFREQIKRLLLDLGYTPNERFIALYGHLRFIFYDKDKNTIDVFFDKLPMCHTIDFAGRLELDYPTITLSDLMLTKLQIVQFEEKDFKDLVCILREHEVGTIDQETVNANRIADVLAKDWGFYYTVTSNLKKVEDALDQPNMTSHDKETVKGRIEEILECMEKVPKDLSWRIRAKVGTKKKWYTEIEYREDYDQSR